MSISKDNEPKFSQDIEKIIFLGQYVHKWTFYGSEVVYDMFSIGDEEAVQRSVSGLDMASRKLAEDILHVTVALRSVGGYDFKSSQEERLKFVRSVTPRVFDAWVAEYERARELQSKKVEEVLGSMGQ